MIIKREKLFATRTGTCSCTIPPFSFSTQFHLELISYYMNIQVLLDFSLTVKAAPHECVIRTSQPEA